MNDGGFIDMITAFFGGAVTTLIGAFTGRLMWHSGEVKLGRRRFFGKELLWEIPVAVGMALIGEAAARYIGLSQPVSTGFVATLPISGPAGPRRCWRPGSAARSNSKPYIPQTPQTVQSRGGNFVLHRRNYDAF
jgi:hypothetical protein